MTDTRITFNTAKLAKAKKFSIGSKYSIIEYLSDFVYDNDPNHRESHKAGELRSSEFFNKNNVDGIDLSNEYYQVYEQPTKTILQKWLREVHFIHIAINRDEDNWKYELYTFHDGNKHVPRGFTNYKSYEDALEIGLQEALSLIKD